MNKQQKADRKAEKEADFAWAQQIKGRASWECEICGKSGIMHAHHIIPRENRKFRHDLMNGSCLCCLHHKFSLEISPHKNAFMFFKWLRKYRENQYNYLWENSNGF